MVLSLALLRSQIQGHEAYTRTFEWAAAGNFHLDLGYTIDHLSTLMLVIVSTVALLVMIYTDGYMAHDAGYVRFYAYLSLFSSSMLGLVVSANLVQIYIFWELVGMCSYLLIGFWFDRPAAADACQKAFVTNRVGDFGLLLGMLGLYWATGSFEFHVMGERLSELVSSGHLGAGLAALFAVLVFLGPVAKSAQFPLHVWLPDAMEGPTPISALIHAATMVAAGVFLIARMYPVFEHVPAAMTVIAWTGAFTAFLGATIALTQNDIKKGLAYSTISQLGYMVMAMGIGSYTAGLFHLMTHAYFKAMLFLCSGSVIHGMEGVVGHDPVLAQDMRVMGGLRKYMPITATTFLIGTLAICGIPPFAGFWSKDEILGQAFTANPALWAVGWLTAGLTAFYMFRMYFMTFEGEFKGKDESRIAQLSQGHDSHSHDGHRTSPHESPLTMTFPLMVLAIPSVAIGLLGVMVMIWPRLSTAADWQEGAALGAIMILAATLARACVQIQVRQLVKTDSTAAIVFWFSITATVLSLATLPFGWVVPPLDIVLVLICGGLIGGAAQILVTSSLRYGPASMLAPCDYVSMLFAIVIGFVWFGEWPTPIMLIGAVLVIVGNMLVIWREHQPSLECGRARSPMDAKN